MSLLDHLPHTATATRRRRTKDTLGGSKDSYPTTVFTDKECWRQAASADDIMKYQRREQVVTHKIYFAEDPGIDEKCILTIGSDVMEVRSVLSPDASAGMGVLWKVMVELKDG